MKRTKIVAGHQQVMPYLLVEKADALIDFIRRIFRGQEMIRILNTHKKIQHSEIKIGDSTLFLAEASGKKQVIPGSMYVYVKDTDLTYYEALDAGAVSLMAPLDEDDNTRSAGFRDPFGNIWWIATLT
ncbi:VOC family protein [Sinomicrobium kalidii]|uniref:VOC family protein n=1 Tax=Sinomicrobium kalidii TaxID=2900738 RepID=UPI001E575EB6|nr:VOC family protein [Sinomicrobium kalidii]UGU18286.1 VOC family protein [Sinomicrobium kalidii]